MSSWLVFLEKAVKRQASGWRLFRQQTVDKGWDNFGRRAMDRFGKQAGAIRRLEIEFNGVRIAGARQLNEAGCWIDRSTCADGDEQVSFFTLAVPFLPMVRHLMKPNHIGAHAACLMAMRA